MSRFYSNENIAVQLVIELRGLGHDVLTSLEAGNANAAIPDVEVLAFAAAQKRILLSHNRRDFLRLHQQRTDHHQGMVLVSFDTDFRGQAERIDDAVRSASEMTDQLIRVNRPGSAK